MYALLLESLKYVGKAEASSSKEVEEEGVSIVKTVECNNFNCLESLS